MINVENSKMRLKAAAHLMVEGESMQYAAGVYSLPIRDFQDYLGGLFADADAVMSEINKPKCYQGHIADSPSRQSNIEPPSFQYDVAKQDAKDNDSESLAPYIIVTSGDDAQPDYRIVGNGMTFENSPKYGLYDSAVEYIRVCQYFDELERQ